MLPLVVVAAVAAGTAARIFLPKLHGFHRRRRRRTVSGPTVIATSTSTSTHSRKQASHPEVLKLLQKVAPSHAGDDSSDSECTFCLESVQSHQIARTTRCNHVFHAPCLEKWVLYVADTALDWRSYTFSADGGIRCLTRFPTCPNCSAQLDVLPKHALRTAMLTSVARSLSLRDLHAASEIYDAWSVLRDAAQRNSAVNRSQSEDATHISNFILPRSYLASSNARHNSSVSSLAPTSLTRAEQRGWGRSPTPSTLTSQISQPQFVLQASS